MPNYVRNDMTFPKKFKKLIVDKDGNVDFNLAVPMPDTLDIEDSSTAKYAIYYYSSDRCQKSKKELLKDKLFRNALKMAVSKLHNIADITEYITDSYVESVIGYAHFEAKGISEEEIKKAEDDFYEYGRKLVFNANEYKYLTWYPWANDKWGTKWNAMETCCFDLDKKMMSVSFQTAWGAPEAWLKTLCKEYHVPFTLEWEEEQGFRGKYTSDGQKFESEDLPWAEDDDEDYYDEDD